MVEHGQFIYLTATLFLLCFVVYALMIRVLHILYSKPLVIKEKIEQNVNQAQTISQFILFGSVIAICFYQPGFLVNLINGIVIHLPK